MTKIRVDRVKGYTVMSNYHLRDKSLSLKAIGLMSFMLSLPEDWDYSIEGLSKVVKDGRDAIRTAIKELEDRHYLIREQKSTSRGLFAEMEYHLYMVPYTGNPLAENPTTANQTADNPTQISTDLTKHELPSSAISSVDTTDIATEEEESPSKKLSKKSSPSGKTLREDFEEIWKLYPNKQGKKKAFAAYERAIRDGVENADILDGVKRYAKYCQDRRDEKRYIKHGDTWFNGACWQDEYDDTPSRPQSALEQGTHLNENLHKAYERERAEGRINEYGEAPF